MAGLQAQLTIFCKAYCYSYLLCIRFFLNQATIQYNYAHACVCVLCVCLCACVCAFVHNYVCVCV